MQMLTLVTAAYLTFRKAPKGRLSLILQVLLDASLHQANASCRLEEVPSLG